MSDAIGARCARLHWHNGQELGYFRKLAKTVPGLELRLAGSRVVTTGSFMAIDQSGYRCARNVVTAILCDLSDLHVPRLAFDIAECVKCECEDVRGGQGQDAPWKLPRSPRLTPWTI